MCSTGCRQGNMVTRTTMLLSTRRGGRRQRGPEPDDRSSHVRCMVESPLQQGLQSSWPLYWFFPHRAFPWAVVCGKSNFAERALLALLLENDGSWTVSTYGMLCSLDWTLVDFALFEKWNPMALWWAKQVYCTGYSKILDGTRSCEIWLGCSCPGDQERAVNWCCSEQLPRWNVSEMPMNLSAAEAYKAVSRISSTDQIWFRLVLPCRWKSVELNQINIK
jgi:hypothetical protein